MSALPVISIVEVFASDEDGRTVVNANVRYPNGQNYDICLQKLETYDFLAEKLSWPKDSGQWEWFEIPDYAKMEDVMAEEQVRGYQSVWVNEEEAQIHLDRVIEQAKEEAEKPDKGTLFPNAGEMRTKWPNKYDLQAEGSDSSELDTSNVEGPFLHICKECGISHLTAENASRCAWNDVQARIP